MTFVLAALLFCALIAMMFALIWLAAKAVAYVTGWALDETQEPSEHEKWSGEN